MKNKTGTQFRYKTKKWFQELGYSVEYLEKYQNMFIKGRMIYIKQDLFGSDGIAMNGQQLIFWQCKSSEKNDFKIKEAIRKFKEYPFPPFVDLWIIKWIKYNRKGVNPEVVRVLNEPIDTAEEID